MFLHIILPQFTFILINLQSSIFLMEYLLLFKLLCLVILNKMEFMESWNIVEPTTIYPVTNIYSKHLMHLMHYINLSQVVDVYKRQHTHTHTHFLKNYFFSCLEGSTIRICHYLEHDFFLPWPYFLSLIHIYILDGSQKFLSVKFCFLISLSGSPPPDHTWNVTMYVCI